MGVCRTFPRSIVFATTQFFGLRLKHLFLIQEITRVSDIILHTLCNSTTGNLYRTSLKILFIECGVLDQQFWTHFYDVANLTTNSLVQSTCLFLSSLNIWLKHDINLSPQREGDEPIMHFFLKLQTPFPHLSILNRCHLFLQS
jgi:hypothetical protein